MASASRAIIAVAFISITLAACTASPAPTPMSTPSPTLVTVPPELSGHWELVHVVVNGEVDPPFYSGQWIRFSSERHQFEGSDGGRSIAGSFAYTNSHSIRLCTGACRVLDEQYGLSAGPIETWKPFEDALVSVVAYEIRNDELWLYYPEDGSNALVFQSADEEN
jgi:hypothetical protein